MLESLSPGRRLAARCGVALTIAVLGVRHSEVRSCSACWADLGVRSYGVVGAPLWRCEPWTIRGPADEVARFLPEDHVHQPGGPGRRSEFVGLLPALLSLLGTGCSFGDLPSEFAVTLVRTPGFADFVDTQIREGRLDVAVVRRLIAVPGPFSRAKSDWDDDREHAALLATGDALWNAWTGGRPGPGGFWNACGHPVIEPRRLP